MIEVRTTEIFDAWIGKLRDDRAVAKIAVRLLRLSEGNPGDVKPVGEGVSEMRIEHGPGYRVYFKAFGAVLAVILCGGDKSRQAKDIAKAKRLAREIEPDAP